MLDVELGIFSFLDVGFGEIALPERLVFLLLVVEFFLVLVKIQFFIGIKEFAVFQIIEQSVMSPQIINHPFLVCISVFEMFSN